MLFKSTAILALGASAALASPLQRVKRQETTSAAASTDTAASSTVATDSAASSTETASGSESVTGSAAQSTATTSVEATATGSEAASSVASAISSIAASSGASAAPETTTPANDTSSAEFAYGCPDGYSLTYVIGTSTYPEVDLEQASSVLSNWTGAVPPPIMVVESEGDGVGATRTWEVMNITVSEELTNQTETDNGSLIQNWNTTMPINVTESLVIANATSDFTLYTNTTSNETSVQLYVNFCVNDQPAGLELYAELVTAYLTGLNELFSGESNSTTGAAGTSSAASTTSGESTSSAATDSATSTASGVTDTVASGASSVGSAGLSGVSSVASAAIGGVTGGVTGAIGAATSAIAGAIPTRL